jgi:ATP-dependent DNA ligase
MSTATQNTIPNYDVGRYGVEPKGKTIIERVDMEYRDGGSDKVYILILSQDPNTKVLYTQGFYGRRHNHCAQNPVYEGISEKDARSKFKTTQSSKLRKGYKLVGQQAVAAVKSLDNKELYEERILFPMNAQPLKEGKKKDEILDSNDWIAEEKEDGVRLTIHFTPSGLRMFSRNAGKDDPTRPLEKTQAFGFLRGLSIPEKYVGTIIDVEAMAPGMDSATISGHINATDGRDNSFIFFKAFDLLQEGAVDITNLDWKFRRMKLTQLFDELAMVFGSTTITSRLGPTYPVVHPEDRFDNGLFRLTKYTIRNKEEFHYDIIARKGEGTMWKNINAKYKEGARPANTWYKWKKQDTADVVICGFTDGQGKYNGEIGAVKYAEFLTEEELLSYGVKKKHIDHQFRDGKDYYLVEIGQCSGMTDAQRTDFTQNQGTYLGRVMEVEYMERTSKGALRHPRYLQMRDDKQSTDCLHCNQK